jgi:4-hydroxybenzoate polyprenyltransferase
MYSVIALVMNGVFPNGWLYVLGVILYMGIGETLAKDIRDIENDSQTGKNTTPVVFGHKHTTLMSAAAFILGSCTIRGSSLLVPSHWNPGLTAALVIVMTFWCARVIFIARRLVASYSKTMARNLHVESIHVFIVANLLFIVGLTQ